MNDDPKKMADQLRAIADFLEMLAGGPNDQGLGEMPPGKEVSIDMMAMPESKSKNNK